MHFNEKFVSIRPLALGGGIIRPLKKDYSETEKSFLPVDVLVSNTIDTSAKARKLRRNFKLGDEDIKNIIESGTIPKIKQLIKLRKSKLQNSIKETDNNAINNDIDDHHEQHDHNGDIRYDPEHKDETFLTSVHITGGQTRQPDIEDDPGSDISWNENNESDDESENEEYLVDNILPNNIQSSVRALSHALKNPVSYWRVMESSYLKPTFCSVSKVKKNVSTAKSFDETIKQHANYRNEALTAEEFDSESQTKTPANSLWSPLNNGEKDDSGLFSGLPKAGANFAPKGKVRYKLRDDLIEEKLKANIMSNATQGKTNTYASNGSKNFEKLSKIAAIQRAKTEGRFKSKNEFDDMTELMNMVEQKINTVEVNLGKILIKF